MPPTKRPFPRFIADASQDSSPTGGGEERLLGEFAAACEPLAAEAGSALDPETVRRSPDRAWGGRGRTGCRAGPPSPRRGGRRPGAGRVLRLGLSTSRGRRRRAAADLHARADFTDVTAEDNPDRRIDINDDVIGSWRTDGRRGGDVTLIWGLPLVRGAVAATAELDGEPLDQAPVSEGRFTLIAVDAVHGFGDDLFLEVKLWDRGLRARLGEPLGARRGRRRGRGAAGEQPAVSSPRPPPRRRDAARPRRAGRLTGRRRGGAPLHGLGERRPARHQPLLDRARANGGGREYAFAPSSGVEP